MRGILNFTAFQTGWLACVLRPGVASLAYAAVLVALHFTAVSRRRVREGLFVLAGSLCGVLLDGLWRHLGVLIFPPGQSLVAGLVPAWLIAIWMLFLTTLNHSLAWVGRDRRLRWLLPPPAGALAYVCAARLGSIEMGQQPWGVLWIGLGWLVLYPSLVALSHWLVRERGTNELA